MRQIYCNPDVCPNCYYIGEGDSICNANAEIVLSDWEPTEAYMKDCPFSANNRQVKKRRNKRRWRKATRR